MKSKNIIVLFVVIFYIPAFIYAQKSSYFKFSIGYNAGSSPQMIMRSVDSTATSFVHTPVKKSFGQGISVQISRGTIYNEIIGFELDLGINYGNKFSSSQNYNGDFTETKMYGVSMYAIPNIILTANVKGVKPYFKCGPVFSNNRVYIIEKFEYQNQEYNIENKLSGSISFGLNNSFGLILSKNEYNQFYIEINSHQLSFSPRKGETIAFKVDNVEHKDDLYPRYKEVEFQEIFDEYKDNPSVTSEPSKSLKPVYPFSHIGISMGVKINL